jgi:integration host factor subunit alpha
MTKTGKTVTRADLYETVYKKSGLSRTEASGLVELPISSRRVMVFKPSAILKRRINGQTTGKAVLAPAEPRASVPAG